MTPATSTCVRRPARTWVATCTGTVSSAAGIARVTARSSHRMGRLSTVPHSRRSQSTNPRSEQRTMGLFTKDIKTLDELFDHGLQDIYYAENQILKALPKLIEASTNPQLRKGLKDHLEETEEQIARLEQIFQMREEKPKGTKCHGVSGLIKEGDEVIGNVADKHVLGRGHCFRAGRRALRNHALRRTHRLGPPDGPQRL